MDEEGLRLCGVGLCLPRLLLKADLVTALSTAAARDLPLALEDSERRGHFEFRSGGLAGEAGEALLELVHVLQRIPDVGENRFGRVVRLDQPLLGKNVRVVEEEHRACLASVAAGPPDL